MQPIGIFRKCYCIIVCLQSTHILCPETLASKMPTIYMCTMKVQTNKNNHSHPLTDTYKNYYDNKSTCRIPYIYINVQSELYITIIRYVLQLNIRT